MNRILFATLLAAFLGGCQFIEALMRKDEPESEPTPVVVPESESESEPEPRPAPDPLPADARIRQAINALSNGQPDAARADLEAVLLHYPGHRIARRLMRQIDADPASLFEGKVATREVQPGDSLAAIASEVYGDGLWFYGLARLNDIRVPRLISVGQQLLVPESVTAMPDPPVAAVPPAGTAEEPESGQAEVDEHPAPVIVDASNPEATARALLEADREDEAISLLVVAARGNALESAGQELLLEAGVARSTRHLASGQLAAAQQALDRVRPWIGDVPQGSVRLAAQETRIRARLNHRQAVAAMDQGEYREAYDRLNEAVEQDPSYHPASRSLSEAESLLIRHDHERALRAYRDQDLAEAIRLWDQVLAIDPEFEPAIRYRERAQTLRERLEEL